MPGPLEGLRKATSIGPSTLPSDQPYGSGVGQMRGEMPLAPFGINLSALNALKKVPTAADVTKALDSRITGLEPQTVTDLPQLNADYMAEMFRKYVSRMK